MMKIKHINFDGTAHFRPWDGQGPRVDWLVALVGNDTTMVSFEATPREVAMAGIGSDISLMPKPFALRGIEVRGPVRARATSAEGTGNDRTRDVLLIGPRSSFKNIKELEKEAIEDVTAGIDVVEIPGELASGGCYVWSESPFEGSQVSHNKTHIKFGRLGRDISVTAGASPCWVGGMSYSTVANGWSHGVKIPAGETRLCRLTREGDGYSFSRWRVSA